MTSFIPSESPPTEYYVWYSDNDFGVLNKRKKFKSLVEAKKFFEAQKDAALDRVTSKRLLIKSSR